MVGNTLKQKIDMEEKIDEKLEQYGLSRSDLTDEQMEELKEEINQEKEGMVLVDSVLFEMPVYSKKKG